MRKVSSLALLGCALLVGLACSGDSTTPTAPVVTTSALTSVTAESAAKIFICHGDRSEPTGVVVEVSNETLKRHSKHLSSGRDCQFPFLDQTPGEPCSVLDGPGTFCFDI
jgi:hypothetical protein